MNGGGAEARAHHDAATARTWSPWVQYQYAAATPSKTPAQKFLTAHLLRPGCLSAAQPHNGVAPPSVRHAALAPDTARPPLSPALRGVRGSAAARPPVVPVRGLPRRDGGAARAPLPLVRRPARSELPERFVSRLRPPSPRLHRCACSRIVSPLGLRSQSARGGGPGSQVSPPGRLAGALGALLAERYPFRPNALLVPVPLHPARLRARGFNQALLLARALGRRRGLPLAPRLLVRTRATDVQARLPAAERRRNLDGAFAVRAPRLCRARSVVRVDDVLTTGATADACARALLAAGAARVDVYTVGRAP